MVRKFDDYFAARAADEDRLAAAATHPAVKATHESFAAAYRAQTAAAAAADRAGASHRDAVTSMPR